jgi:Golgi apparatus protein 1
MKITLHSRVKLGLLPLLFVLSVGSVSAQTDVAKTLQEKLVARIAKLQSACAKDIRKYCKAVTPGEGRVIYCLQAYEDKISSECTFELEDSLTKVQASADGLKGAIIACKAEIAGVCGKTVPGQGRVAACLLANKSTASKDCADAITAIEGIVSEKD